MDGPPVEFPTAILSTGSVISGPARWRVPTHERARSAAHADMIAVFPDVQCVEKVGTEGPGVVVVFT